MALPPSVGPYRILGSLGQGGMGSVLLAQHPTLPRQVALKVVGKLNDPIAVERFRREGELLARIRHPNVVGVHELGHDPRFGDYLVTERVEGSDLVQNEPLDPQRAAELLLGVAEGVQALHDAGVLHRDLKPANVVLRADGTPVLIDFGLAWSVDAETLTKTGMLVGTPAFMAPEQVRGRSKELDARTDVYGLGALGFCLLTGRPPFDGGSLHALLAAVMGQAPEWKGASVPRGLRAVVDHCLAKAPEDRYGSAAELKADLERWLSGEAPLALGAVRRRMPLRLGTILVAASCLVLAATLVLVSLPLTVVEGPPLPNQERMEEIASRQLERILRNRDASPASAVETLRGLSAWLEEHSDHPAAARALETRTALRGTLELPVRLGDLNAVPNGHPLFLGERRVIVPRSRRGLVFDVRGQPVRDGSFRPDRSMPSRPPQLGPTWWTFSDRIYAQLTSSLIVKRTLSSNYKPFPVRGVLQGSCEVGLLVQESRDRVRLLGPEGKPPDHPLARRPPLNGEERLGRDVRLVLANPRTNHVLLLCEDAKPDGSPVLKVLSWTGSADDPVAWLVPRGASPRFLREDEVRRRRDGRLTRAPRLDLHPSEHSFLAELQDRIEVLEAVAGRCSSKHTIDSGEGFWLDTPRFDPSGTKIVGLKVSLRRSLDDSHLVLFDLNTETSREAPTGGASALQLSPDRRLALTYRVDGGTRQWPTLWLLELP